MFAFSSRQQQGPSLPTCPHSAEICTRLLALSCPLCLGMATPPLLPGLLPHLSSSESLIFTLEFRASPAYPGGSEHRLRNQAARCQPRPYYFSAVGHGLSALASLSQLPCLKHKAGKTNLPQCPQPKASNW